MKFFHLATLILLIGSLIGCDANNPITEPIKVLITPEEVPDEVAEAFPHGAIVTIEPRTEAVEAIEKTTEVEPVTKTTPEEWESLIDEQGDIPVLELITAPEILLLQVADGKPQRCISLKDEVIDGVRYTLHRATWIRFTTTTTKPPGRSSSTKKSRSVIESSITEGEACGIKATEIERSYSTTTAPGSIFATIKTVSNDHRLILDMSVDGVRRLYISPSTWSKK